MLVKELDAIYENAWSAHRLEKEGSMWHYTKADVFEKVIHSGTLWLSDVTSQNTGHDELSYFQKEILTPLLGVKSIPLVVRPILRDVFDQFTEGGPLFVATLSFCKLEDDMAMWKDYGEQGRGVAIEFDVGQAGDGPGWEPVENDRGGAVLETIVYEPQAQKRSTESLIDGAIQLGRRRGIGNRDQRQFWLCVTMQLIWCAIRSKEPTEANRRQAEIRAVHASSLKGDGATDKIDGTDASGRRHVCRKLPKDAIRCITIGPESSLKPEYVREVLGALPAEIRRSRVDMR